MNQPTDQWKKKYLETLEDLERKEQSWKGIDAELRRSISRLTFIADGNDPELDLQLERLRNRIRGEQDM